MKDRDSDYVYTVIKPREADIGGLIVRRSLPVAAVRSIGPWVFFDHMGPAEFAPGNGLDVIPHPHINLATVTYLFDGEIVHRDSLGNAQAITPGAVNLMVAGSGIVHSERTGPELRKTGHRAHGLQLWYALPGEDEEAGPSFDHYPADSLPRTAPGGVEVRVLIGKLYGLVSPVRTFSPTLYAEALIPAGKSMTVPASIHERGIYLVSGELTIGGKRLSGAAMALLETGSDTDVTAEIDSRIVIIGGEPLGTRYMWWNFVSSRKERIERAMAAWKAGEMGSVPGETEPAPLPESDSFSAMKEERT